MSTVFTMAGAFGSPSVVPLMLGGEVTNGHTIVPVVYPNWGLSPSLAQGGAAILDTALHSVTGPKVALGHSLGAVCMCYWLCNYGPTSSISPSDLSFILLGNSVNPYTGLCWEINWFNNPTVTIPAGNRYAVKSLTRQYDGFSDFPEQFLNLYADMNGIAGQSNVHSYYQNVSLADPTNVWHDAGNNVQYGWSVTWPVPLLGPTQAPFLVAEDQSLRPQIESAYSRPVTIPPPVY